MPNEKLSRIQAGTDSRKFGEAPILGKVPRSPASAVRSPKGKVFRKRRRKKLSKAVIAWTCLIAFVSACVLAVIIAAYFRAAATPFEAPPGSSTYPTELEDLFFDEKSSDMPTLDPEQALGIVKAAFENRDPAFVADHFLLDSLTDPNEALRVLAHVRETEGDTTSMKWIGEIYCNGMHRGQVVLFMDNGERQRNRLAQLLVGNDGRWRIDLDSYLRIVSPDWKTILSSQSGTSLVRVFLAPDSYYNGIYADESEWRAYALASPDVEDILYGYAKHGSSQHKAIARILSSEHPPHRATLRILKNPESGARQFEISRVVAENWVVGDNDFDEAF